MKHPPKMIFLLILMFLVAQLIGILVANVYLPQEIPGTNETTHNLPYGFEPPKDISPQTSVISIIIAIAIAVLLMLTLMHFKLEIFLRLWFFLVVIIGLGITFNAFLIKIPNAGLIAIAIAIPFAAVKVFQRNIIVHNFTELLIYPGIASVFIPLLSIWTVVLLLILISIYDIYAVWHAGFMQKMAQYQIEKVRVFSGFFVPYLGKKEKGKIKKMKKSKTKGKKVKVNVAILGGGDVVFPIILAGVVLGTLGLIQALLISVGATIALGVLFYFSEKGKFYPAMPFITTGSLVALGIALLI